MTVVERMRRDGANVVDKMDSSKYLSIVECVTGGGMKAGTLQK